MNSEIVLAIKDSVKLNILQDILSKKVSLSFCINNGNVEDYLTQIHNEKSRVKVYGKYNISEDPTGEFLTIRPVAPDCRMTISTIVPGGLNEKNISVISSSTRTVSKKFEISSDMSSIDFIPCGKQEYTLRISYGESHDFQDNSAITDVEKNTQNISNPTNEIETSTISNNEDDRISDFSYSSQTETNNDDRFESTPIQQFGVNDDRFSGFDMDNGSVVSSTRKDHINENPPQPKTELGRDEEDKSNDDTTVEQTDNELERIEKEISVIEHNQSNLSQKKQSAIDHLEKIEAEYKKDYSNLEQELEDIKSRMDADASIIEHYKDQDVMPIEILFQEVKLKLEEAENQIRLFIEAKQRKTMEIESEIKSNKKQ